LSVQPGPKQFKVDSPVVLLAGVVIYYHELIAKTPTASHPLSFDDLNGALPSKDIQFASFVIHPHIFSCPPMQRSLIGTIGRATSGI